MQLHPLAHLNAGADDKAKTSADRARDDGLAGFGTVFYASVSDDKRRTTLSDMASRSQMAGADENDEETHRPPEVDKHLAPAQGQATSDADTVNGTRAPSDSPQKNPDQRNHVTANAALVQGMSTISTVSDRKPPSASSEMGEKRSVGTIMSTTVVAGETSKTASRLGQDQLNDAHSTNARLVKDSKSAHHHGHLLASASQNQIKHDARTETNARLPQAPVFATGGVASEKAVAPAGAADLTVKGAPFSGIIGPDEIGVRAETTMSATRQLATHQVIHGGAMMPETTTATQSNNAGHPAQTRDAATLPMTRLQTSNSNSVNATAVLGPSEPGGLPMTSQPHGAPILMNGSVSPRLTISPYIQEVSPERMQWTSNSPNATVSNQPSLIAATNGSTPVSATGPLSVSLSEHATAIIDEAPKQELTWEVRPHLASTQATASPARLELPTHVAHTVVDTFRNTSDRPIEIAMNPVELGRVRMLMATNEGGITLTITADRPETLDLMRRNIDDLAKSFSDLGYDDIAFAFGQGDTEAGHDHQIEGRSTEDLQGAQDDMPEDSVSGSAARQHTPTLTETGIDIRL